MPEVAAAVTIRRAHYLAGNELLSAAASKTPKESVPKLSSSSDKNTPLSGGAGPHTKLMMNYGSLMENNT